MLDYSALCLLGKLRHPQADADCVCVNDRHRYSVPFAAAAIPYCSVMPCVFIIPVAAE